MDSADAQHARNTPEKTEPTATVTRGQRPRLLHTMLRVRDLEASLDFYAGALGMRVLRRENYPAGRFTLAFVGYGTVADAATIELTWNWDRSAYEKGDAFGHIAIGVADLAAVCAALAARGVAILRPPGPMGTHSPDRALPERIAFVADPDGYRIELVEEAPLT